MSGRRTRTPRRRRRFGTFTVGALILTTTLPPVPGRTAEKVEHVAPVSPQAFSLLSTKGQIDVPVRSKFFGKRARIKSDTIKIKGKNMGEAGPFELGSTDLVLSLIGVDGPPAIADEHRTQLADLDWKGSSLKVKDRGKTKRWKVRIGPSRVAPQPIGDLFLLRTEPTEGFFDIWVELLPRYVFNSSGKRLVFDAGGAKNPEAHTLSFEANEVPWSTQCGPPSIPMLTRDVCLGSPGGDPLPWALNGPDGNLIVSLPDPLAGPPPQISPSAEVAPDAIIGSGAMILDGSVIGPGALVGPRSVLGPNVQVGEGGLVGADSQVGPGTVLGPGSVIGNGSFFGEATTVEVGSIVDDGTRFGPGVFIEPGVIIGARADLGDASAVAQGTSIGSDSELGAGAFVFPDLFLASGSSVGNSEVVTEDIFTCLLPGGESFPAGAGICNAEGGAVSECAPPLTLFGTEPPGVELQPGNPVGGTRTKLDQDVDSGMVAPSNGGQPYVADTHDCDDFAEDLEVHLQGLGYNATFTCYWKLNPDWAWWKFWQSKWIDGHCVTDVHLPDGSTVWIEPQWSSGQGAVGQDLDFDNDGTVGVSNGPTNDTTDDGYRIEVYDSAQAARDAGVVLD